MKGVRHILKKELNGMSKPTWLAADFINAVNKLMQAYTIDHVHKGSKLFIGNAEWEILKYIADNHGVVGKQLKEETTFYGLTVVILHQDTWLEVG